MTSPPKQNLWSFLRNVLTQGHAQQQDYMAGKYPAGYEEFSAHVDEAARKRADELEAMLAPASSPPARVEPWLAADGQKLDRALIDVLRNRGLKPSAAMAVIGDLRDAGWALFEVDLPPAPPARDETSGTGYTPPELETANAVYGEPDIDPRYIRAMADYPLSSLQAPAPADSAEHQALRRSLAEAAREILWIACVWNDHNFTFDDLRKKAKSVAEILGVTYRDVDSANAWLERIDAALKEQGHG